MINLKLIDKNIIMILSKQQFHQMKHKRLLMGLDGILQKEECLNMGKLDILMKSVCNK